MTQHSKFSPSKLKRIIQCPASTIFDTAGQKTSKYAEEGTLLHDYLARAIHRRQTKLEPIGLNKEQKSVLQKCLNIAKKYYGNILGVEQKIRLDWLSADLVDTSGTVDFLARKDANHILVLDWKFGAGIEVYAKDNEQLMAYALGAAGIYPEVDVFTLAIYQPRRHGWDEHTLARKDLLKWAYKVLIPALKEAQTPNPPFNPSDEACLWCNGKSSCKHRAELANKTAHEIFKAATAEHDLTQEEIEKLLLMEPFIVKFLKQLKADYIEQINAQQVKPNYFKLVKGRAIRKWKDNVEEKLVELINPEDLFESKLISPTKAERLVDDDKLKELEQLWYKPEGKPTLARRDDRREEITSAAQAVFSDFCKNT